MLNLSNNHLAQTIFHIHIDMLHLQRCTYVNFHTWMRGAGWFFKLWNGESKQVRRHLRSLLKTTVFPVIAYKIRSWKSGKKEYQNKDYYVTRSPIIPRVTEHCTYRHHHRSLYCYLLRLHLLGHMCFVYGWWLDETLPSFLVHRNKETLSWHPSAANWWQQGIYEIKRDIIRIIIRIT